MEQEAGRDKYSYPEHDKLHVVQAQPQVCGEFFGIDLVKLEEKKQILEDFVKHASRATWNTTTESTPPKTRSVEAGAS